ncbi:MAG: hypothetical protein Q9179_001638 [Wetmoreana sp. 5 TL-2023]
MALAGTWRLLARETLRGIYVSGTGSAFPEPEKRGKDITAAMRYLLQAEGVHGYLSNLCASTSGTSGNGEEGKKGPPETDASVQNALAELAMAEATLLAVLKDDPYPAVISQERNASDKEWMYKGTEIPKVRAHLFARLCIAASEHAGRAEAMLHASGGRIDEDLLKYAKNVRRAARAKACRFFGIDDELGGETGRAIAWLKGARRELGLASIEKEEKGWTKGLGKLKKGFEEKREDRRVERGGELGADGGRIEEGRVVEMLERKWGKLNDTILGKINTQLIPPFEPLLAGMPSGREMHSSKSYVPPELDADVLEKMRAPPDLKDERVLMDDEENSSDEEASAEDGLPRAFPNKSASGHAASEYY